MPEMDPSPATPVDDRVLPDPKTALRPEGRRAGQRAVLAARLLVCLMLGVVTSVLIAWGMTLWIHVRISPNVTGDTSQQAARIDEKAGWILHVIVSPEERQAIWKVMGLRDRGPYGHATDRFAQQLRAIGGEHGYERVSVRPNTLALEMVRGGLPGWLQREGRDQTFTSALEFRSGWPFDCLAGHGIATESSSGTSLEREAFVTVPGRKPYPAAIHHARLPIVPLWPGLVANALAWGAVWFVLLFGVSAAKRWRRAKRGRCVRCGYDLRGLADNEAKVCPECGGCSREMKLPYRGSISLRVLDTSIRSAITTANETQADTTRCRRALRRSTPSSRNASSLPVFGSPPG